MDTYHPLKGGEGSAVLTFPTDDDEEEGTFLGFPGDDENVSSSPSPTPPKMSLFLSLWILFLIALLSCGPPYFAYHAPGTVVQH